MPHGGSHGENGCPKCIINGRFVATAAGLYHRLTHSDAAEQLSVVAAAADEVFKHAIEADILTAPEADEWEGCDEAAEIMSWVDERLGVATGVDEVPQQQQKREDKMNAWTRMFAAVAHGVVAGKPHQHEHAGHEHEHDDIL